MKKAAKDSRVTAIRFRGILESRGGITIETEVDLQSGSTGTASAPVAIMPGRLENRRSVVSFLGSLTNDPLFELFRHDLVGKYYLNQRDFDVALQESEYGQELGADVRLVLSIAFCRAQAAEAQIPLFESLARICGSSPTMPRPLINLFSGGIHDPFQNVPFQQIMMAPALPELTKNIELGLRLYNVFEQRYAEHSPAPGLSASSGMLLSNLTVEDLFETYQKTLSMLSVSESEAPLAIDVAAEHLRGGNDSYRVSGSVLSSSSMLAWLKKLVDDYPIVFLEDPFDPEHTNSWQQLLCRLPDGVSLVGDDLFATQSDRIDPSLASGILLKPNQVGSVSGALEAAVTAASAGMTLCVSHRSGETEDTFICDFAVAVGAMFIKIGGPRRGDRTAKYNQLLRLNEQLNQQYRLVKTTL